MYELEKLSSDLVSYRKIVDRIFSADSLDLRQWQRYFFDVLISVSQLYLDYLLVMKEVPALEAVSSKRPRFDIVSTDIHRERILRKRLREQLESSPHWVHFRPQNPFSEDTGLRTLQDYIDKFALHLPEIYEETFRVELCTKKFITTHSDSALAQLIVGLEHLGRNHISFVQQALAWAADEISWDESS